MTAQRINPKLILGIDALRFFAAMLVVLYHYGFWFWVDPDGMSSKTIQSVTSLPELFPFTNFGWLGVQIFFVISGFVIAFSGEKATPFSFFASRVVRLGPGAWICATLTLLILLISGAGVGQLAVGYLNSVFFVPFAPWIDFAYWTLGIELMFYSLVFGLILFGRFAWIMRLAMVIGLISAAFWLAVVVVGLDNTGPLGVLMARLRRSRILGLLLVHHGIFFALGIFLWSELTKKSSIKNLAWILFLSAVGCIQIAVTAEATNRITSTRFDVALPCLLWVLCMIGIAVSVRLNAWLHRAPQGLLAAIHTAGMMTYPLYLVHQVAGAVVLEALVLQGFNRWVALCATVALALLVAWAVAVNLEPALQRVTRNALARLQTRWAARANPVA